MALATLMLSKGAGAAATNDADRTAADLARAKGHEEMAVWLRPRRSSASLGP